MKKKRHPRRFSKSRKYWGPRIKRSPPARKVKRTVGKTTKRIKGVGEKVWVGKDTTKTGWMSKKRFEKMKRR